MKTISTLIITLFIINSGFTQAPQAFNYQGVARDLSGNPLSNQSIGIQIKILQASLSETEVYKETHFKTTNNLGLFSIKIGSGTIINGNIENIDWGNGPHFIQIEIDESGGNNYQIIGTSQLLSVPFALYAEKSGEPSLWNANNSAIYYNDGNVGIGTTDPKSNLEVTGQTLIGGRLLGVNNTSLQFNPMLNINKNDINSSDEVALFQMTSHTSSDGNTGDAGALLIGRTNIPGNHSIFLSSNDELTSGISFKTRNSNGEDYRMVINNDGNVGIGTTDPKSNLEVTGQTLIGGRLLGVNNTSLQFNPMLNINKNDINLSDEVALFQMTSHTSSDGNTGDAGALLIGRTNIPGNHSIFLSSNDELTSGISFKTRNSNGEDYRMVINNDGNVGIGTTAPTAKIHVSNGDVFIEDINKGVIMKSPSGQCWRMTVSDEGQPVFSSINCPN